jgi:hypothetical protein
VKYGPQAPHAYTPFTATLTNPTDLKAVIRAGARSVLGRTLDDNEVCLHRELPVGGDG